MYYMYDIIYLYTYVLYIYDVLSVENKICPGCDISWTNDSRFQQVFPTENSAFDLDDPPKIFQTMPTCGASLVLP